MDPFVAILYVIALILGVFVALAPLGCWMALGRIEKILKERTFEDPKQVVYYLSKQNQTLTDIRDDGVPVDVRSIKKSSPA